MNKLSETNELTGEPRNTYINSLILVARQIEYNLYFTRGSVIHVLDQLKGLIHMLDAKSKEKLKDTIKTLDDYRRNANLVKGREQVEILYSQIMDYLHETYLRECRFAKPKHEGGKLEV